jgi:hypothetical protein
MFSQDLLNSFYGALLWIASQTCKEHDWNCPVKAIAIFITRMILNIFFSKSTCSLYEDTQKNILILLILGKDNFSQVAGLLFFLNTESHMNNPAFLFDLFVRKFRAKFMANL